MSPYVSWWVFGVVLPVPCSLFPVRCFFDTVVQIYTEVTMPGLEVKLPGDAVKGDRESPAYAHLPAGATRGMVVIHEIFGRQPDIDGVVDRFAAAGYAAVAPDLFFEGRLPCIRAVFSAMKTGAEISAVRQALRARDWLCAQTGLRKEQVGIIGFCFGGGFALLAGSGWAAVSTNYGVVPPTERLQGIGPVIACYGGRDVMFKNTGEQLKERLAPLGVTPEVLFYPDAGHAFLTNGNRPIISALTWPLMHVKYNAAIAEDAWVKIIAFFNKQL